MTILEADVTDSIFTLLPSDAKTSYLAVGNSRFESLCLEYAIDNASIADPAPYIPKRIGVLCVLIAICYDKLGNDAKEIAQGGVYDPNKAKLDAYLKELDEKLKLFTPEQCGYTDDDETDNGTSSICLNIVRA